MAVVFFTGACGLGRNKSVWPPKVKMNAPICQTKMPRAVLWRLALASLATVAVLPAASITYVGKTTDRTDFHAPPKLGTLGSWFPQFNSPKAVSDRPTNEGERNGLPSWAGPLVHLNSVFDLSFPSRTFSQDGPCRSVGGFATFNLFTLPNGEVGRSGIIFDPHAAGNTSNSVNRIKLGNGTPSSFYLRIVVDNTGGRHNAISRIRARGNHAGGDLEPNTFPAPGAGGFNGIADVYTFRYDGFTAGDFIKIQFNGMPGDAKNGGAGGGSFAGLMFDPAP